MGSAVVKDNWQGVGDHPWRMEAKRNQTNIELSAIIYIQLLPANLFGRNAYKIVISFTTLIMGFIYYSTFNTGT